jgi:Fe2+ transport system protein FeoA
MLPLNVTKSGEKVDICCLDCSCDDACRLRELGCVEGVSGKIISNQSNVILQVGETRLAINGKLARRILVNPK